MQQSSGGTAQVKRPGRFAAAAVRKRERADAFLRQLLLRGRSVRGCLNLLVERVVRKQLGRDLDGAVKLAPPQPR